MLLHLEARVSTITGTGRGVVAPTSTASTIFTAAKVATSGVSGFLPSEQHPDRNPLALSVGPTCGASSSYLNFTRQLP